MGQELEQPILPIFDGLTPPPPLVLEHFSRARLTFPVGTGLGWDALHPRALTRLPVGILEAAMQLLMLCEAAGRWPRAVQLVIIVFLAKVDGGFRPIGLIPALPRIWMRARRNLAKEWEASQARPYLCAGLPREPQLLLGNRRHVRNLRGHWGLDMHKPCWTWLRLSSVSHMPY